MYATTDPTNLASDGTPVWDATSDSDSSEEVLTIAPIAANDGSPASVFVAVIAVEDVTKMRFGCTDNLMTIEENVPVAVPDSGDGISLLYKVTPSSNGGPYAVCKLTGSDGDADIFLQWDAIPIAYNDRADGSGECFGSTDVTSVQKVSSASTLYVTVFAFKAFSGVVLECYSSDRAEQTNILQNAVETFVEEGETSAPFSLESCRATVIRTTVSKSGNVTCEMTGESGDADKYFFWDTPMNALELQNSVGVSQEPGPNEVLTVPVQGQTLSVLVVAHQKSEGLRIRCDSVGDDITDAPVAAPLISSDESSPDDSSPSTVVFHSWVSALMVLLAVGQMVL